MKKRKRGVMVMLSGKTYKELQKAAQKTGLSWMQIVEMILTCEIGIVEYAVSRRKKLLKQLKIWPTNKVLYRHLF